MTTYGNGFTLDFVYCKNCYFFRDKRNPLIDNDEPAIKQLKEELQIMAEQIHDTIMNLDKSCTNRQLVISYNRVMVENVEK